MMNIYKKFLDGRPWLCLSSEKYRLRQYYVLYTALFVFTCCGVFCWHFLTGRTFIAQNDSWPQNYKALVYYAKYMRSIVRELLYNHRFVLPEWDFAFGEGNDIIQTLHYYLIGDPFAVFSVLIPTRFLWIYYDFMALLRLYLSGIAFSCLCFYTKKNIGRYAVMAGALTYAFCYWAILNVTRLPYFINPMLYFPLIILGVEKILRKERPYLLIVSVFFAAISNFYYFYVIALLTVAYVTVRLITKYKTDLKSMLNALLRISSGSVLGTAMGGIILLPVMFAFLNDTRMDSAGNTWHLVYPLPYYGELLGAFFHGVGDYWLRMGYAAPVILAIFLLFMRKRQHLLLKTCFLICAVIILVPALGQFLNGMSYMSNKWCWAFALLCAYIFSVMWSELMNLKSKEALKLALFLSILLFLVICSSGLLMSDYLGTLAAAACIGIAFIFLLVLSPFRLKSLRKDTLWKQWKQIAALALVIVAIGLVSSITNAPIAGNDVQYAIYADDVVEQLMLTEVNAVEEAAANADDATGFYRYSGRSLTTNAGLLYNMSSTNYYWTISNPAITSFRSTMELRENVIHSFEGYDDRTALITLSSVTYFAVPDDDNMPIPYGFTYVENAAAPDYKVYWNENALPISYVYDAIISEDRWSGLSSVEKQEAMLQSVLLTGYDGETQDDAVGYSSRTLEYSIDCNDTGVTFKDYGFVVTSANSSATVSFDGLANSETYFSISGLDFNGISTNADLTLHSSSNVSKTIKFLTEDEPYYSNRHDYTMNLDYSEEPVTSITITFSEAGVYSFDSIEVICQPMDGYAEQVASLKKTCLENVDIGTDAIRGTVSLDRPQVLCFSIPYSAGWTAYVDGEEATLYQANIKNMALVLDAGGHDVKLVYHTPYLRMGAGLSAAGFVGFFALLLLNTCKKRRAAKDKGGDLL